MKEKSRDRSLELSRIVNKKKLFKLYILRELQKKNSSELYSNEIFENIKEFFKNYNIPIYYSVVNKALNEMDNDGYVKSRWKVPKKRSLRYYRITDEGIAYYNMVTPNLIKDLQKNKDITNKYIDFIKI